MNSIFIKIRSSFLTALGNVKVFKYPFFMVYDPSEYKITGKEADQIRSVVRPGSILLRGYDNYLDSKFIPQKSGLTWDGHNVGNGWSHGAIYVGDDTVIHAIAEGVQEIHLLDFLKCDRIAVFSPDDGEEWACKMAKAMVGTGYDFDFSDKDECVYCFELVAKCYPDLGLEKFRVSKMLGLLKRDVYLAQSFFDCKKLRLRYVCNPS